MNFPISFKDFQITWLKSAVKIFESLPILEQEKILGKIDILLRNISQIDLKKLKGHKDLYRIRSGCYRIVVQVSKENQTLCVIALGHRQGVYNLLKKLSLLFGISSSLGLH